MFKNNIVPNPKERYPLNGYTELTFVNNTITNNDIIVGDFTYYSGDNFEEHVTHHYDFNGDKLIIGKFCQIGKGINFVMNGANHQMNAASTFPFYIFDGWSQDVPPIAQMPIKGDTVVGNDVWFGENVTVMPGVTIGDGAIIGANSVVASDVAPFTIVAGNPIKFIRKRFDDELISLMLKLKWWDKSIEDINSLIPIITCSDLDMVKDQIKEILKKEKKL